MAAIQAQGSTLEISTGSGGAETLTDIALGYPTILTSASHALINGDVVTIAGVTGDDAASINKAGWVVSNVTADTFAIQLDSTDLTLTAAGTATPAAYTTIAQIKSMNYDGGSASSIDTTNLDSSGKESVPGLPDYGSMSVDTQFDVNLAGQAACEAAYAGQLTKTFRVTLPSGVTKTWTFSGHITKSSWQLGVDGIVAGSMTIKLSGLPVWS